VRIRLTLALIAAATLLAACSGGAAETSTQARAAAPAPDDGGEGFPRSVVHHQGETTIPAPPERVVVLDTGELDSVTALGLTPVGAVRAPVEDGLLSYLADDTQDTELVGTIDEPDLERIAALEPDLILSSTLRHEAIYDELSQIAPTVFTETVGVVWKDNFLVHAEALGMEDQAQQMLDDYDARADALGASLEEPPTVSMVRFLPGETRLYQKASFIGTVLEDVGLPRPPSQDVDDFAAEISPEQIAQADADVIFVTHYGAAEETTRPEIIDAPLWQSLDAVQRGDVHEMPDDVWMLGIGIRAANIVLDDLEAFLQTS
jgi:iron complex transport system substrate-binding protein